jgi:hypothetical protein
MWFSSPTFLAGRRQVRMSSPSGAILRSCCRSRSWDLFRSSQVFPVRSGEFGQAIAILEEERKRMKPAVCGRCPY